MKLIETPQKEPTINAYLNDLRADPNNMSKWLPAITPEEGESRKLRIPKTVIVQVPDDKK